MAEEKDDLAYSQLVDAIYETALEPENYLNFAKIWDDQIVAPILADDASHAPNPAQIATLKQHFTRAMSVFEKTKVSRKNLVQNFLDDQKFAAALALTDGSLIAGNAAFSDRFSLEIGQSFYSHAERLTPTVQSNGIGDIMRWQDCLEPIVAARYFLPSGKETIIIVERLENNAFADVDAESLLLIKSCHAEWMQSGANLLARSFGFTEAEMEIARALYEGQRSGEIAETRGRSLATVQRQIKSLLAKAEVSSQVEFISLAIGLMHVVDVAPTFADSGAERSVYRDSFRHVAVKSVRKDRLLHFAHYGHPDGDPVLFLHGHTSTAEPTDALLKAAAAEKLQIIAPSKPGAAQSSPDDGDFQPTAFVEECLLLLDSLKIEKVALAGHAMSGVYAIEAAALYPDRFSAVGLFDTGIPMTAQEQFEDMPEASRRIFLAAKNTPELLYAPFAFAAASAIRDEAGHRAFMKSQFEESRNSTELLKLPHIYQPASRAMRDYMNTPRRSVDELVYWVSDWMAAFRSVTKTLPVKFFQSEFHAWQSYQRLVDFCREEPNAQCQTIKGSGELFVFDKPGPFCRTLKELARL